MIFSGSDVDELWLQPNSFTGMTYSHETIDPILNIIYYPVTTIWCAIWFDANLDINNPNLYGDSGKNVLSLKIIFSPYIKPYSAVFNNLLVSNNIYWESCAVPHQ